jgi:hypothetical protein
MQQATLDAAVNLASEIGAFRLSGGTECGHSGWACDEDRPTEAECSGVDSHACGAKFDVGVGKSGDVSVTSNILYILQNYSQSGVTSGGYPIYRGVQIGGYTYDIIDERTSPDGAHFDFAPQSSGG